MIVILFTLGVIGFLAAVIVVMAIFSQRDGDRQKEKEHEERR